MIHIAKFAVLTLVFSGVIARSLREAPPSDMHEEITIDGQILYADHEQIEDDGNIFYGYSENSDDHHFGCRPLHWTVHDSTGNPYYSSGGTVYFR